MDGNKPQRRRKLTPKEQKALQRQRQRERELAQKKAKQDARYREEARKQARKNGTDAHVVVQIPARPENPPKRRKKTIPDIIQRETDKRVRDLPPSDHRDGYYVNEVEVRRQQAQKQRKRTAGHRPKPVSPKKRKVRRAFAYIGIIAAVIVIGVVLSLTVLFKTENIEVIGNKYYEDSKIIGLAGVSEGENIFMAAITGDDDAVTGALPYIKKTKIGFKVPNTLTITVTNETPYYSVKSDGRFFIVGDDGRILEQVDEKPEKLMFVNAPKLKYDDVGAFVEYEKPGTTSAMQDIAESLVKNNYKDITGINVKKSSDITITYDNRIKIKLGLPEDIDYKIRTAFTIINTKLDPNGAGTIEGVLNVSGCNTTKKSYFNEGGRDKNDEDVKATQSTAESEAVRSTFVTAAPTEAATQADYYGYQYATEGME